MALSYLGSHPMVYDTINTSSIVDLDIAPTPLPRGLRFVPAHDALILLMML